MSECVSCMVNDGVAVVLIKRPEALNALNQEVLQSLYDIMVKLDADAQVRAVVLTGSGDRAFAAGADIAAMRTMNPSEAKEFSRIGQKTMNKIETMRPFVIAAVNGFALGGGCELAMACDMRVASRNARIGIPEVTLGVIPGFGGTQRLPRLVGLGYAKELLATGRQVKAEEAKQIGLVNHVTESSELLDYCLELAEKIAKNSSSAISLGKQAMNAGAEMDLDKALKYESSLFGIAFSTPDQSEGMGAFLEKRKANFE